MSEIYKRSMGQTYNPEALRRELANGTAGYDSSDEELDIQPLDIAKMNEYRMHETLSDIEVEFFLAEEAMREVAIEHPKYTWHVGHILSDRLDELKAQGKPVDAEMYIEAHELATEIVAANPDKNADELSQIVMTMVEMIQAEYKLRHYEYELAS